MSGNRTKIWYYNRTNTCDRCENKLIPGKARREYDGNNNWTGKWICKNCYTKDYDKRPGCGHDIIKQLANSRTGNLNPNCNTKKGNIFEEITCKVRGVKNLNIENDNFRSPIDHSRDVEYGIIQSKGAVCGIKISGQLRYEYWGFFVINERNKEFDNLIAYCLDKDMKNVERVYIFPREEVVKRTNIGIYKNPTRGVQWYEKYRIDERPYNEAFHSIMKIDGD